MTKKSAVGASFKTSTKPLNFVLAPNIDPVRGGVTRLQVLDFGFDIAKLRDECKLDVSSKLAVVVEVSCPSFRVRRKLWSHEFRADDSTWMNSFEVIQVPSDIIRAGCTLEVQVVVIEPVPKDGSRLACSVAGGVVARGFREYEPKNGGALFPIRAVKEPSLWSFRFGITSRDDLEKPIGAAFRLNVDSEHFMELLDPECATAEVRSRTQDLLMVEALTTAAISVLGDEDIAGRFDELLQGKASEKTMNTRSAEFFLLGLMRRLPEDVASMRQQLQENPVRSVASIREVMAKLIASPA